jgi:lysophospholipase L1-like esterase
VKDYSDGVNVAIFGDSVAHGGGAVSYSPRALEYSYATYIDFPVLNLSKSGDTAKTSLERFATDVLPFHPKNLIISTGTNCLRDERIKTADIIRDLKAIGDLCIKNNIRPIYLTLMPLNPPNIKYVFRNDTDPHWHDKLVLVNNFLKKQEFVIDIEPYFYDAEGMMNSALCIDGIHPDIYGKMLIGELINLNKDLFIK